ncbi:hypothetical protein MP228_003247 [Amoeboaphelidium protococcarum]|nr:hypothetical protein MP228_003247 [Amoeboaphelidium protococcarum]
MRTIEPTQSELKSFEIVESKLKQSRFQTEITSDSVKEYVAQQADGGWFPGYFERYFHHGICKNHETYVGHDSRLGYIAISFIYDQSLGLDFYRVIVRTSLSCEAFVVDASQMQIKKKKSSSRAQHILQASIGQFMAEYCAKIISNCEIDSSRDQLEFTNEVDAGAIAASLKQVNYLAIAPYLLNYESNVYPQRIELDVIPVFENEDHVNSATYSLFNDLMGKRVQSQYESFDSLMSSSSKSLSNSKASSVNEQKRARILDEIYNNELNYLQRLKILEFDFKQGLIKAEIMTMAEVNEIMPKKLPHFIAFHEKMIEAIKTGIEQNNIASQLEPLMKDLAMYEAYGKDQKQVARALTRTRLDNQALNQFLASVSKQKHVERRDIDDIMIEPVQKIPRYALLFKELLRYTDMASEEYGKIESLIKQFDEVAKAINRAVAEQEGMLQIHQLQQSIQNCPPEIISASRKIIGTFAISEICFQQQDIPMAGILYLMSDSILVTQVQKVKKSAKESGSNESFVAFYEYKDCIITSLDQEQHAGGIRVEAFTDRQRSRVSKSPVIQQKDSADSWRNVQNCTFFCKQFQVVDIEKFLSAYRAQLQLKYPIQTFKDCVTMVYQGDDNYEIVSHIAKTEGKAISAVAPKSQIALIYTDNVSRVSKSLAQIADRYEYIGVIEGHAEKFRMLVGQRGHGFEDVSNTTCLFTTEFWWSNVDDFTSLLQNNIKYLYNSSKRNDLDKLKCDEAVRQKRLHQLAWQFGKLKKSLDLPPAMDTYTLTRAFSVLRTRRDSVNTGIQSSEGTWSQNQSLQGSHQSCNPYLVDKSDSMSIKSVAMFPRLSLTKTVKHRVTASRESILSFMQPNHKSVPASRRQSQRSDKSDEKPNMFSCPSSPMNDESTDKNAIRKSCEI